MRAATLAFAFCLSSIATQAASVLFTDLAMWQSASGAWLSDDFSSAPLGGPQPSYTSPTGVTLRRSLVSEDNGQLRSTTVNYSGDTFISGPPYQYLSSSNQVFINSDWPQGTYSFAGPNDAYNRRHGWEQTNVTRWPDNARRRTRSDYNNHVVRSTSVVTGSFEDPVTAFGFLYRAFGGPWPGSLRLQVNNELFTVPVLPFAGGDLFLGVQSTTPISSFRLSAARGAAITSAETFTNRPCFGAPGGDPFQPPGTVEVCVASGSLQSTTSSVSSSLRELFVGAGPARPTLTSADPVLTPEPSTGLLMLAAIPLFRLLRRR